MMTSLRSLAVGRMAVFPFVQVEFRAQTYLSLVRSTLSRAPRAVGQNFFAGGSEYHIESVTVLPNSTLRTTKTYSWNYESETWAGAAPPETIQASFVEVLQRISVSLSRVVNTGSSKTFEGAGDYEGDAVVRLTAWPNENSAMFDLSVTDFEPGGNLADDFRTGLQGAVRFALRYASITSGLPNPVAASGTRIVNVGVAASNDGSRVAIRQQIGVPVDMWAFNEWVRFYAGDFPDTLAAGAGGSPNDWAVVLSEPIVKSLVIRSIESAMQDHASEIRLLGGIGAVWAPEAGEARVNASWQGELIDACVGLGNIDADLSAAVRFSVPGANTLQTDSDVDWDLNDLEAFGCSLAAAAIGLVSGGALGFEIGGFLGAGLGASIGGIGAFIGGIVFASNYVPDINAPNCTQSDKRVTCTKALNTQIQVGVNTDGSAQMMQLNPSRVGGHVDGLFLAGRLTGIPSALGTRAFITGEPFGWSGPSTDCGVSGALVMLLADHMADLAAPVATVSIVQDAEPGDPPLDFYAVTRVSADPLGVFPDSGIQIRRFGTTLSVLIVATPTPEYYKHPYKLSVRVATSGGTKVMDLGQVPQLTDETTQGLKREMLGRISDCYVRLDDFTRKFGRLNPRWLPDPPPDELVARERRSWAIQVHGLEPGEVLAVEAEDKHLDFTADERGLADIRLLSGAGEVSLQRVAVAGHTAADGELPQDTPQLSYLTNQVSLIEQAELPGFGNVTAMDLGWSDGRPVLAVVTNGEVFGFDLANPVSPRLVLRSAARNAMSVLVTPDDVYVGASDGLTRWSLSEGAVTRLSDQPIVTLLREGGAVAAALRGDRRRLLIEPGALPVDAKDDSILADRERADQRLRWPAQLVGLTCEVVQRDDARYVLCRKRSSGNEVLGTYDDLPEFANTAMYGDLVVQPDEQAAVLRIYARGATASNFPAAAWPLLTAPDIRHGQLEARHPSPRASA